MPKVSFDGPAIDVKETAITPTEETMPLANQEDTSGDILGEFTTSDIQLPRLNLVNKSGKLGDEFTPGSFVLNRTVVLSDGKSPINFSAIRVRKRYQENLPFDSEETKQVFDTAKEVRENGGAISWKKGPGNYSELADVELIVQAPPEGLDEDALTEFPYSINGGYWARCIYTVSSTSYSLFAKPIISQKLLKKDIPLLNTRWSLTSAYKQNEKNSWYSPRLAKNGNWEEPMREFFAGIAS